MTIHATASAMPAVVSIWRKPMTGHQRLVGGSSGPRPPIALSTARSRPRRSSVGSTAAARRGRTAGLAARSGADRATRIASTAGVSGPRSRQRTRKPSGSATLVSRPDTR